MASSDVILAERLSHTFEGLLKILWSVSVMEFSFHDGFGRFKFDHSNLAVPCIVGCEAELVLWNRNISLYLAMNALVARSPRDHKRGSFVSRAATKALGALNKEWATSLLIEWVHPSNQLQACFVDWRNGRKR